MRRRGVAIVVLWFAACRREAPPSAAVPDFADRLPGHTVAVAWGAPDAALDFELPALPAWLPFRPADAPRHVRALLGDPAAVAWPSLAASGVLRAALARQPQGRVQVFVDLQQVVDAGLQAMARAERGNRGTLTNLIALRLVGAARLRSLTWLSGAVEPASTSAPLRFELLLHSSDADAGLFGLLGAAATERTLPPLPGPAQWTIVGRLVPAAARGVVLDLLASDGDDAMQMVRELLRGPRLQAAVAAIGASSGEVVACGGVDGWMWMCLGVSEPNAMAGALDTVGQVSADGWTLGDTRLRLTDAGLEIETAGVPRARGTSPPPPPPGSAMALTLANGASFAVAPVERGLLRVVGQVVQR